MPFEFKCKSCSEVHRGVPGFGADAPLSYYVVPETARAARCKLDPDACVVDGDKFFVRGCLEIPVRGEDDPLIWGVWVALKEPDFRMWEAAYHDADRERLAPMSGLMDAWLKPYPDDTLDLEVRLVIRAPGMRPLVVADAGHPIAVEQREVFRRNGSQRSTPS